MKVKKGDTVLVVAGKDKGAKGKVIAAYPDRHRVLVEGVGRVKRHTRVTTSQRGSKQGGIITQESAIHVSNVMVVDGDGKATRIGYRVDEITRDDGREKTVRVRVSRRSGKDLQT